MNAQQLTFGQGKLVGRVIPGRAEIANIRIQAQPGRVDFTDDGQCLAQVFHKWSIQVFKSQHHPGLSRPAGAQSETFDKVHPCFFITGFIKNIISHHLNDTQPNISRKLDCLAQGYPAPAGEFPAMWLPSGYLRWPLRHMVMILTPLLAMERRSSARSDGMPSPAAQALVALVDRNLDEVIAGLPGGGQTFLPTHGSRAVLFHRDQRAF